MTPSDQKTTYYDASAPEAQRFAPLQGTVQTDICIAGGGFTGVAAALMLRERGYTVALVEAKRIGSGASGRNGGQLIGGISGEAAFERQTGANGAKLLRDLRYVGHDRVERVRSAYQIDCDFKYGWMEAATRPKHLDKLKAYVEEDAKADQKTSLELVPPDKMQDVLRSASYCGGMIDRRSGHLHPLKLIRGEARAASRLGVQIFEDTPAVKVSGGLKPVVETPQGRVEAQSVILAGEIYNDFGYKRLRGLMLPTGSYIIATEPLDEALAARLNPQDLAVADSNVVLDYFRLTADKRMLFGGRCNYSNRDPADIGADMAPRLWKIFPELKSKRIDFSWGGRIGIVLNRIPAIGRLEPNLYYVRGFSGHGVNVSHITAEILSGAVSGTNERFDMFDRIRHRKMPATEIAGNQMLALGMLYYRLKDLL